MRVILAAAGVAGGLSSLLAAFGTGTDHLSPGMGLFLFAAAKWGYLPLLLLAGLALDELARSEFNDGASVRRAMITAAVLFAALNLGALGLFAVGTTFGFTAGQASELSILRFIALGGLAGAPFLVLAIRPNATRRTALQRGRMQ